jgi:DNA-binding PadR family transcriptional regulator
MDERELLLLGLLRREKMHGYQLSQFLENRLESVVPMKRSTAYFLLNRLAKKGLVHVETEREGRRPERRVYRLTSDGETAFTEELRRQVAEHHPSHHPNAVGFLFLDMLPVHERASLIKEKLNAVQEQRQSAEERLAEHTGSPAYWMMSHRLAHLRTEEEWLQGILDRLEARAAIFPPSAAGGDHTLTLRRTPRPAATEDKG